jgi:phage tail-like protein
VDANLQRPYQLADEGDWELLDRVAYDAGPRSLRLVGARAPSWDEEPALAEPRLASAPGSFDRYGTSAVVVAAPGTWAVHARGAIGGDHVLIAAQPIEITDAAIGLDDVLYVAIGGAVRLHDLRGRWADVAVPVGGAGRAWRLAAAPGGGVFVLVTDAAGASLGRITGLPARPLPYTPAPGVFRPHDEDPDPPRFVAIDELPDDRRFVAIASSPGGAVAVLGWPAAGDAELLVRGERGWSPPQRLAGAAHPYSLAWLSESRIATLIAVAGGGTAAAVYPIGTGVVQPVGEPYPLRAPTGAPFLHGVDLPPRYPGDDGALPLLPISWPSFARAGVARARRALDTGQHASTWHRIYLEAAIPPGCAVKLWLAATDLPEAPPLGDDWYEHRFGAGDAAPGVPRGTWLRERSEVAYHDGMLACPSRPGVAGLFTALVQRAGRRVRTLAGRYLWVRVELLGDGRASPEIAAVRVYGGRRDYAGLYLPELYREEVFGPEGDDAAAATPADFLGRMLGTFESVLTPLEDRIRSAWLLTAPTAVPEESLDWLASWVGFVFAADLPSERRRAMLDAAHELYRRRGTPRGLARALDLALGGAVARGEVVILEDFRLRRTFATILGADLSDPDDPLTVGLTVSGNSYVGETLFLGDEERRELLALFEPDLPIGDARQRARDAAAVAAFFDRLAHRVTVLVHQEVREQDLGLIRQVIDLEAPAHVEVKIVTATQRFRVAVSSLVGVDTFLAPTPPPGPVRLDRSLVGVADLIQRLPSLDPRLGRG